MSVVRPMPCTERPERHMMDPYRPVVTGAPGDSPPRAVPPTPTQVDRPPWVARELAARTRAGTDRPTHGVKTREPTLTTTPRAPGALPVPGVLRRTPAALPQRTAARDPSRTARPHRPTLRAATRARRTQSKARIDRFVGFEARATEDVEYYGKSVSRRNEDVQIDIHGRTRRRV